VTALSHETSEALNDPFGNNIVPTWQFPGLPGVCQANLETGDPVEVLPTATVPIFIKEKGRVFQYHPQIEALLQWFEKHISLGFVGETTEGQLQRKRTSRQRGGSSKRSLLPH
jgi:hypothetical protein